MANKLMDPSPSPTLCGERDSGWAFTTTKSRRLIGAALAEARARARSALPFRSVNRAGTPGYDPGMQRHHLLPRQLLGHRCFGPLFDLLGRDRLGFEDFRTNGLLLPASNNAVMRMGLPLHRGPHRDYNELVMERVGQVEARWAGLRGRAPEIALDEAAQRLGLLQRALRRRLLNPRRKPLQLSRFDPLGQEVNFTEIDTMVDMLWSETAVEHAMLEPNPGEQVLITPGGGSAGVSAFSF